MRFILKKTFKIKNKYIIIIVLRWAPFEYVCDDDIRVTPAENTQTHHAFYIRAGHATILVRQRDNVMSYFTVQ